MAQRPPGAITGSARRRARALALPALAVLTAGLVWICHTGPAPSAFYPPCPLLATTGLLCPGCGSARVLHDLAHGHLGTACAHNILVVFFLPCLVLWGADTLWRGLRHDLPPRAIPRRVAFAVLALVLVFWITRNLPWYPFTLLAPST